MARIVFAGTVGGTTAQFDANFSELYGLIEGTGIARVSTSLVSTVVTGASNSNSVSVAPDTTGGIDCNHLSGTSSGIMFHRFNYNAGTIGSITQSGTTGVAYNTTSDYRLKTNPQPLTGSGAFIDALQPKTWEWLADGSDGVGFIAHEVAEVSPGSVVGAKDAVDDDGQPVHQVMEYGNAEFMANIVAELQSLRARVAALEA